MRQDEGCVVVPAEGSNKTKLRKTITTLIIKQSRIFGLGFWTCPPPCPFPAWSKLPAGPPPSSLPRMHFRNATANAIFGHGHNSFTFYQLRLLLLLQWMSWTSRRSLRPGHPPIRVSATTRAFQGTIVLLRCWAAFSVFVYASFEISMNCRCNRPGHGSWLRLMCYTRVTE